MQRYLNAADKSNIVTIGAFHTWVDETIQTMLKSSRSNKTVITMMKYIKSYTKKALDKYLEGLDQKEAKSVLNAAHNMKVAIGYTSEAKRIKEETELMDENMVINRDDFLDVAAIALYVCKDCQFKKNGEPIEQCNFRRILMEQGVYAENPDAPEGVCQYQIGE